MAWSAENIRASMPRPMVSIRWIPPAQHRDVQEGQFPDDAAEGFLADDDAAVGGADGHGQIAVGLRIMTPSITACPPTARSSLARLDPTLDRPCGYVLSHPGPYLRQQRCHSSRFSCRNLNRVQKQGYRKPHSRHPRKSCLIRAWRRSTALSAALLLLVVETPS